MSTHELVPIGRVHSELRDRQRAPKQGGEGAPAARLEIFAAYTSGLDGIVAGREILVLTWLHEAQRDVLKVHPRDEAARPLTGVFATRSADRPNPLGLHRVTVLEVDANGWLTVQPLEAIDGTPIVDLKPVLSRRLQPHQESGWHLACNADQDRGERCPKRKR